MDDYDEPELICPMTGTYCVRAFCEDYGCADKLGVPLDEYDYERGSLNVDEIAPRIPRSK